MINFTPIIRPYFAAVNSKMIACAMAPEESQRQLLHNLLLQGRNTLWGKEHGFEAGLTYEQWAERCPLVEYEDIRSRVMQMVAGEKSILWPGMVTRFAQSSGTSGGKSKYIPITGRGLASSHYRGGTDVVAHYLSLYRDSRLMSGKALILGGSFANELNLPNTRVQVGDLSAHLIKNINKAAGLLRVPSTKTALMADWHKKLPRLVSEVVKQDVTNLSGVPSWMMTVLKEVLKATGAETIDSVWPNLEVFFHGGIAFEPYREEYHRLIKNPRMRYLETYNASEGFFGIQWEKDRRPMLLLLDVDTFYEFIPVEGDSSEPVPVWRVEPGKVYELVITSSNGLWRYRIGDTVRIESLNPVTFTIAGRTKHYINAFGEELIVYNADAAIAKACGLTDASVANYTAAPVYATTGSRGCHQWLVEWEREPEDIERFADILDDSLRQENSDYDAKRKGDIFLSRLILQSVPRGTFDRWLQSTGKLGGQRKVPRLCPDRHIMESMLTFTEI